jgi:hypothetical protein
MLAGAKGTTAELIVNAAYPIGDLLLVSMVGVFVGLSGAGRGRSWLLLGTLARRARPAVRRRRAHLARREAEGRWRGRQASDRGTGYSSLRHIKQLPVDELKIDRSFVIGMGAGSRADAAIVQTAVDLGCRLGIGVVAEGVEDDATLKRLAGFGVDVAQGYHIARPMPATDLETWLGAGGFVLTHDEDVERAGAVDALDAVQLDVRGRART